MNIEALIQTLDTPANESRIMIRDGKNEPIKLNPIFTAELIAQFDKLPPHSRDYFDLVAVWKSCTVIIKGSVNIDRISNGDRLILTTEDRLVTILADGVVVDFETRDLLVQFEFSARLNQFDPHGIEGTTTLARFLRARTAVTA